MTIDNSICLIEDYLEWAKQYGLDGSGVQCATNKLLEVVRKYQKIEEIVGHYGFESSWLCLRKIKEVIEE